MSRSAQVKLNGTREKCSRTGFESTRCSEFEEDNSNDLRDRAPSSGNSSRSTSRKSKEKPKTGDDKLLMLKTPSKTRNLFSSDSS